MNTVYEKALGELAADNEKFDLGGILKHQGGGEAGTTQLESGELFHSGVSDSHGEKFGKKEGELIEQEQTQEEAEFFQGMMSIDTDTSQPGFSTEFNFQFESKPIEATKDFEIEPPRENQPDMNFNFGDTTPHKQVLDNNLINAYNSTVNFEYTEKNTPGTQSPTFEFGSDPDHFLKQKPGQEDKNRWVIQPERASQPPEVEVKQVLQPQEPERVTPQPEPRFIIPHRKINLFDDDENDASIVPPTESPQEVWDFNKKQASPYTPPMISSPIAAPEPREITFNFPRQPVEQFKPPIQEEPVRENFQVAPLNPQPRVEFDFSLPPEDQSNQKDDFGFGKFETGWKKQKHNLLDNDPIQPQVKSYQPVIQPAHIPQNQMFPVARQDPLPSELLIFSPQQREPMQPVQRQMPPTMMHMSMPTFDLLSMRGDLVPAGKNPFDEEHGSAKISPPVAIQMPPIVMEIVKEVTPKVLAPTPFEMTESPKPIEVFKPSLNNFRVSQIEALSYREEGKMSSCDLFGGLNIWAVDPKAVNLAHLVTLKGEACISRRPMARSKANEVMGAYRECNESQHGHSLLSRVDFF